MADNSKVRELGRPVVTAWLDQRSVNTLKHGDAADLMERVGAAIEAEQISRSSATGVAPEVDEDLRNAFVQAAIEVHVGFQHPRPWADCDMAICNERKRLSQQPSTEADSADDVERDQAFREFWREQDRERPFDYQHPERYATFTKRYAPPAPASPVALRDEAETETEICPVCKDEVPRDSMLSYNNVPNAFCQGCVDSGRV